MFDIRTSIIINVDECKVHLIFPVTSCQVSEKNFRILSTNKNNLYFAQLISLPFYSMPYRFCANQRDWLEFPTRVSQEGVNPLSSDNTTKLYNPVLDAYSLKRDSSSLCFLSTSSSWKYSYIMKLMYCLAQLKIEKSTRHIK